MRGMSPATVRKSVLRAAMGNRLTKALIVSVTIVCAVVLSGCLFQFLPREPDYPSDEVFEQEVAELVCGENIKALGDGNFSSLDRDLEFTEKWLLSGSSGMYGTVTYWVLDSEHAGSVGSVFYDGDANYYTAVAAYWNDYILESLNKYSFDSADCSLDGVRLYKIGRGLVRDVRIFISPDITSEQKAEIESFLADLRDICIAEKEFHTSTFEFQFSVDVFYMDDGSNKAANVGFCGITADTSDEELKLDNIIVYEPYYIEWSEPLPGTIVIVEN